MKLDQDSPSDTEVRNINILRNKKNAGNTRYKSFKIIDLAKAIVPGRKHKIIGARPGEKISEILITKDESKNTLEFKNHYIINSEIFGKHNKNKYKLKDFEYNSSSNKQFLNEKKIRIFCEKLKLI